MVEGEIFITLYHSIPGGFLRQSDEVDLLLSPTTPHPQSASGERGQHADLSGVRLLPGLVLRLNLFAFAVPVFGGDQLAVFEGCFCRLLAILVPPQEEAMWFAVL